MQIKQLIIRCMMFLLPITAFTAPLETVFSYSPEETKTLQNGRSEFFPTNAELQKWDSIAEREIEEKKINFFDYTRMFTYLYAAQADAVALSHNFFGKFVGSLDPISYQVLSLFIPNLPKPLLFTNDPYSQALANLVFSKILQRVNRENALHLEFIVPTRLQADFSSGLGVAKWIPWYARPSIAYWPPAPPSMDDPIWKEQIQEIKQEQEPMTEEKKQVIYRWASLAYPWSSDWRSIVNKHLACQNVPFLKRVMIRSNIMIGMYDTVTTYSTCKYHYLVIRPKMFDPSITYEIAVPKHPSYPSGHSAESALTVTIMSHYFPEEGDMWRKMAMECGLSRIWAGIHYPLDNLAGREVGIKVGERILNARVEPYYQQAAASQNSDKH